MELKKLVSQRKFIRSTVTTSFNKRDTYESLNLASRTVELAHLTDYKDELPGLDSRIQELKKWDSDEAFDDEIATCEVYKGKIRDCIALLNYFSSIQDVSSNISDSSDVARSLLRQPVAPLPSFSGSDDEDLIKFLSEFEQTTAGYNYPDRDLLLLLKQQVSHRAKLLIGSLEADKQNYKEAKNLLLSAFASEELRKNSCIRKLSELKLKENEDPFEFVSKVKTLVESVKYLDIDSDDFLTYFVWRGLNETFRGLLTQITTKTMPSIHEILQNFFIANERYGRIQKDKLKQVKGKTSLGKNTNTFAVKVNSLKNNMNCPLCLDAKDDCDHFIHKCPSFTDPKSKVEKLKLLKGCVKCGKVNHQSEECKFRFRRKCKYCSRWHFDYLCVRSEKGDSLSQSSNDKETVASGIAVLKSETSDTILSTFTFEMGANKTLFRGLKDSGSQSSFVTESFAKKFKLQPIKKLSLTVSGFNTPQTYASSLVQVPIKLNGKTLNIKAMVVKTIKLNINLPHLGEIVEGFLERGYNLADSLLTPQSNNISNINLLLGADYSFLMPGKDVCFGKNSLYVDSAFGVMLMGNIKNLMKDLPQLVTNDNAADSCPTNNMTKEASTNSYSIFTHSFFIPSVTKSFVSEEIQKLDYEKIASQTNIAVLNKQGKLLESELHRATDETLDKECRMFVNYDSQTYNEDFKEQDDILIKYSLNKLQRNEDGRIIVPLLWNGRSAHLLAKNNRLSKIILQHNLKKLKKDKEKLYLMDSSIKEQIRAGVIEKVENLECFFKIYPNHAFLPHMGVFRLERETTKCRIVFLSNLSEPSGTKRPVLSNNQCMFDGPNLNQKLSSALINLRFDRYILTFDLCKAFSQLQLSPQDQAKLLFYWFNDVEKGDFSLAVYKNVRLSFGLRCSPFLLMIALYYILIIHSEDDDPKLRYLKHLVYGLFYMDNGAVTFENIKDLRWAMEQLEDVFKPFQFSLQQFTTNVREFQEEIDTGLKQRTEQTVKLFGLMWDRINDTLFPKSIVLDPEADTKRLILKTIASHFDLYNINIPILNRARLFMHSLQCDVNLSWDKKISRELQKEWKTICHQANSTPQIPLDRYIGPRNGTYRLIAFTDASRDLYGVVVYIVHEESGKLSFLIGKNRIVNKQLKRKSIPSLEFNAITLGVETLKEIKQEISGPQCINPINIEKMELFTDSLCSLHWLNAAAYKFEKMGKQSVFVMNRLKYIENLCDSSPITFNFIAGKSNPADCITRCISYKLLMKTNYILGPKLDDLARDGISSTDISVNIPNPHTSLFKDESVYRSVAMATQENKELNLIDPSNFSSFSKLVRVFRKVLMCVEKWKSKIGKVSCNSKNYLSESTKLIIKAEQQKLFPDIFEYFSKQKPLRKDIPSLVSQINVFKDAEGILRVKSKFRKWYYSEEQKFPFLLSKASHLTLLIISDVHERLAHAGCYSVLTELRKIIYIPHVFSTVKKFIKNCVHCKRFNSKTIKLNQGLYRDFRADPPKIPFRNIFIDHLGPFQVKKENKTVKVWLLCITCTWSRAVNLKVCQDLSTKEFLRVFQMHCFECGVPELCVSDLGTQFQAGANIISDHLNDPDTHNYFEQNNIKPLTFHQYSKGHSELGSMVEICVKMVKRLIFGSIKNNILFYSDFEFLIGYVIHMVNRRPVAFKEVLRDTNEPEVPEPITPEHLIKGYELNSVNLIPGLQGEEDDCWVNVSSDASTVRDSYEKLRKVRSNLIKIYNDEFLGTLISQAVDKKDRYRPIIHQSIKKGDIVLIKEVNCKPNNYPMGKIKEIVENNLGEVTDVVIMKGKTKEQVRRHVSTIIPILEAKQDLDKFDTNAHQPNLNIRPIRKAAAACRIKLKNVI